MTHEEYKMSLDSAVRIGNQILAAKDWVPALDQDRMMKEAAEEIRKKVGKPAPPKHPSSPPTGITRANLNQVWTQIAKMTASTIAEAETTANPSFHAIADAILGNTAEAHKKFCEEKGYKFGECMTWKQVREELIVLYRSYIRELEYANSVLPEVPVSDPAAPAADDTCALDGLTPKGVKIADIPEAIDAEGQVDTVTVKPGDTQRVA